MIDAILASAALFLSVFTFSIENHAVNIDYYGYLCGVPMIAVILVGIYYIFGIYRVMWQYARVTDGVKLSLATIFAFLIFMVVHAMTMIEIVKHERFSFPVYFFAGLIALIFVISEKLLIGWLSKKHVQRARGKAASRRVMIIGAGTAGNMLIHDMISNDAFSDQKAVCVIDDSEEKIGKMIHGINVVGGRDSIIENAEKYNIDRIIVAIPSIPSVERAKIYEICTKTGCEVHTLPSLDNMIDDGKPIASKVRRINVEDLLGREPIRVDLDSIMRYVENKVILVTGGGGSIGSELCRQLAKHNPKKLIIFDIYENNAYDILNELKTDHPDLDITALIGSVRDPIRLEEVFSEFRPEIVYHAAAHKHVPLMEDSPREAIKNNVFGTYNTVSMADKYGAKKFLLISTDKAVNPTNIMGASKRMCEMIVQTKSRHSKTEFMIVRFGNVLGSNGSVIPLFEKQIENGGPVTVTDKRIIRYFMTIPEAVSLVLQAAAYARGGEIFVLDMGKPMKIVELAENLIRLSGYRPYEDIKIEFTGLRPGEKLYEELLMSEEGLKSTANRLIHIGKPIDIDEDKFYSQLDELKKAAFDENSDIRALVKEIVTTYNPK
ncbi:MAG: polysaccharide biosynthesis protein [Ruminococcaceae bacterium]|nr:polysaccharide biosynthesis protein [Oscillospiraceae bacterium]